MIRKTILAGWKKFPDWQTFSLIVPENPCFSLISLTGKNCQIFPWFPISLISGNPGPTKFLDLSGSLYSVMFKSLRVSVVHVSIIEVFSLSELPFLGSLKILHVNSRSPEACINAPEYEEDPESCTLCSEMDSTLLSDQWWCIGHAFPMVYTSLSSSHSFQSKCVFPTLFFIFSTTCMASLGISLIRKPATKSQFVFNHPAIVKKEINKLNFIAFCLFIFVFETLSLVILGFLLSYSNVNHVLPFIQVCF